MRTVRAIDIEQWSAHLDARSTLPALVRRLVRAVPNVGQAEFSAYEGVQRHGWDGIVAAEAKNTFVPQGISLWELGTGADSQGKANSDYKSRSADPLGFNAKECTFVFLTPRKWEGKHGWCAEKRAEGIWKDVVVYDSDNLEQWLEISPAVAIWFARLLGKRPPGVEDVETFWEGLSALSQPSFATSVFVASRNEEEKKFVDWLDGPAGALLIEVRAPTEVIDFAAASLMRLEEARKERALARAIILDSREAFDALRDTATPLIFVLRPQLIIEPEFIASAVQKGHHVVLAETTLVQPGIRKLKLPRQYRHDLQEALVGCGFPEIDAERAARAAGGSTAILKRKLSRFPDVRSPVWAKSPISKNVVSLLWIGGWSGNCAGDREGVADFAGMDYADLERAAVALTECDEPLLMRAVGNWAVLSKEIAWMLVGRFLDGDGFNRFERLALLVLAQDDPALQLPGDKRFAAAIYGCSPRYSALLRKGIVETMTLLASLHEIIGLPQEWKTRERIEAIVRKVLPPGSRWQRWASLSGELPLLAEASPDDFLGAVEADLNTDTPELIQLLKEEGDTLLGRCYHAGVLWGLETLAWTPSYLSRVCRALTGLAERDPGGRWANRPSAAVAEILSPWYPQTMATPKQRIQVIDQLFESHPNAAWRLLLKLLPGDYAHATPTHHPYWRDWIVDWSPGAQAADYEFQVNACAERALENARHEVDRWLDIIDAIERLPSHTHPRLTEKLTTLASETLSLQERQRIAESLRTKVGRNREYHDAHWALPLEMTETLDRLRELFEPRDAVLRHKWLFADWPKGLERRDLSYEETQAQTNALRLVGIREIMDQERIAGIHRLATEAESPGQVGACLAIVTRDEYLVEMVPALLEGRDQKMRQCANGFFRQRHLDDGWDWVDHLPLSDWPSQALAALLCCLPFEPATWKRAAAFGENTKNTYWATVSAWNHELNGMQVEFAARQLLACHRPLWTVSMLDMALHRKEPVSSELLFSVLESLFELPECDPQYAAIGNRQHDITDLIKELQGRIGIDEERLAHLEWQLLPLFRRSDASPATLHGWLARKPDFFVEVLSCIYRSTRETEPEEVPSSAAQLRARLASDLLESWELIPGTQPDGNVDADALRQWVDQARTCAEDAGRLNDCDTTIGELLAISREDSDGTWPSGPVQAVLTRSNSDRMLRGFEIGLLRSRGGYFKGCHEGGEQERKLAAKFEQHAQAIAATAPGVAGVLRKVAERYHAEARREDENAQWDR